MNSNLLSITRKKQKKKHYEINPKLPFESLSTTVKCPTKQRRKMKFVSHMNRRERVNEMIQKTIQKKKYINCCR